MTLYRRDYRPAQYSSYALEIASNSPVHVRGFFDLRQESKKLASIPLLPVSSQTAKGKQSTILRINCVSVDQIDEASFFYVLVSDPDTGKSIDALKMSLHDAKVVASLPQHEQ